jgi:hypothetical protein
MAQRMRHVLFSQADILCACDHQTKRVAHNLRLGLRNLPVVTAHMACYFIQPNPVCLVTASAHRIQSIYGVEELQNGVAYGFDDLPHAIATQHLLLPTLKRRAMEQDRELRQFVAEACMYFKLNCTYEPC